MHHDHDARTASPAYDFAREDCVTRTAAAVTRASCGVGPRLAMMSGVTAARMTWVCTELLALWVVLPLLLWTDALPAVYRISVLVAATVYALWVVRFERVRWDELGFRGLVGFLPSFLQGSLWVAAAVPVLFVAAALLHGEVGSLGRSRPESLLVLLLFYASVSVTSQEFLYSSFFFWRYRPLFSPGFLVGLNAVVFAVAHLVYDSWVSIGLPSRVA